MSDDRKGEYTIDDYNELPEESRAELIDGVIYDMGAPDFVAEVISPASRKRDSFIKAAKYAQAGVREYGLIDQDYESIVVYILEKNSAPAIYTFSDKVPVSIFNNQCMIDMQQIAANIPL